MVFKVGEMVVYPHHGAALIEDIQTRTIKGEAKLYLTLKVAQGDLTIQVPAENCDLVGVRGECPRQRGEYRCLHGVQPGHALDDAGRHERCERALQSEQLAAVADRDEYGIRRREPALFPDLEPER